MFGAREANERAAIVLESSIVRAMMISQSGYFLIKRYSFVVLCACACLVVWAEEKAVISSGVYPVDQEVEQQRLLAAGLRKESVIWLELGNEKSLAIYRPAAEKNSKGAVVILKGSVGNTTPHSALLNDLAEHLARGYWHTLLVYVPSLPNNSGQKRLEAAITFLQKSDAKNLVLVLADNTAPLLTQFLTNKSMEKTFTKIVLLDAANVQGDVVQPFMEILAPNAAILDLSLGSAEQAWEQRRQIARQRNFRRYLPLTVPTPPDTASAEVDWTIKRIRAWLEKP